MTNTNKGNKMLISEMLSQDVQLEELAIEGIVTHNGFTWAIVRVLEGTYGENFRAYPEQNHVIEHGMICIVGSTKEQVVNSIKEW